MSTLTSLQSLGEAEVLVTFDFVKAERAQPNPDKPNPGPGCDAQVIVLSAAVNGEEVEAECFAPSVIARWEERILEEELESA
jgi:hypothetical protein